MYTSWKNTLMEVGLPLLPNLLLQALQDELLVWGEEQDDCEFSSEEFGYARLLRAGSCACALAVPCDDCCLSHSSAARMLIQCSVGVSDWRRERTPHWPCRGCLISNPVSDNEPQPNAGVRQKHEVRPVRQPLPRRQQPPAGFSLPVWSRSLFKFWFWHHHYNINTNIVLILFQQ